MRRPRPARPSQPRGQLGFEPLEPREMLFADAGIDWWSSWDAGTADDWSWTFDDSWSSDPAGDFSWNDSWWVGDTGAGDTGLPADDAGGYDPTADFVDTGVDEPSTADTTPDVMPEPVADVEDAAPDVTPVADVDVVVPPPPLPTPDVKEIVVIAPAEEDLGPSPDVDDAANVVDDTFDVPVVDVPVTDTPATDVPVADLPNNDVPTDPMPQADVPAIEDTGSTSPTIEAEAEAGVDGPVAPPTVVVLPVAGGSVSPVAASVTVSAPAPNAPGASAFGAFGAFFSQVFGRQADATDGASATGQPGTGRPRMRLPFRPIG